MKTAISNFLFVAALGIPLLIIAYISPGDFAGRLLPGGVLMLVLGLAASLYFWKRGKKGDQEYGDERANYIFEKSAKFTFYIMAVAIQTYWGYNFSISGNDRDYPFILLALFWGSFGAALIYNRIRR